MRTKRVGVDASYVLGMLFPDEKTSTLPKKRMVAPALLEYEVVNAIKMAVVRRRIDDELAGELIREYKSWKIEYKTVELNGILEVALEHKLSVYDASYLWLAKELKTELLTWDKKLAKLVSA